MLAGKGALQSACQRTQTACLEVRLAGRCLNPAHPPFGFCHSNHDTEQASIDGALHFIWADMHAATHSIHCSKPTILNAQTWQQIAGKDEAVSVFDI